MNSRMDRLFKERVNGKTVLITGASSGIGLTVAHKLADAGAHVLLVSRTKETLEEVKGQLRDVFINAGGQSFRYIPCLNDNQDHIQALSDLVQHHLGGWPTKSHQ